MEEDKDKQIEAVYSAIRNEIGTRIATWARRNDGTPQPPERSKKEITLTYEILFTWVRAGILGLTQPTLFKETHETLPEVIEKLGKDVYLDEAMRRAVPPSHKIPEVFFTLARITLTPEVIATLNNKPELYQLIPPGRIPPKVYRAGRGDLTYPLAILGKPKPGQNYVTFIDEKNGIKTEAGSMYGVLTEFDFRVLCAIVAFTQRVKDKDGKIIAVARFSQYSIARYLNMTSGENTWKRITEALQKIATFTISHNRFETKGKNSVIDYKRIWKIARTKKEGEDVIDNIFEWDEEWRENFLNYFELIDGNIFGQLGGTEGRLHLYIKRRIGDNEKIYSEDWERIANRLPLIATARADKKRTFIKAGKKHQAITGISFRIDKKDIAHFERIPEKTKETHQIEAREEVEKRVRVIDQAKAQKELTEEQNRIVATLIRLGVNHRTAGEIARANPSQEIMRELIEELNSEDCKGDPEQASYVAYGFTYTLDPNKAWKEPKG